MRILASPLRLKHILHWELFDVHIGQRFGILGSDCAAILGFQCRSLLKAVAAMGVSSPSAGVCFIESNVWRTKVAICSC